MRNFFLITIAFICFSVAIQALERDMPYIPYYTGPLIAPTAKNVPPGEVNTQPYIYLQNAYGEYNHKGHRISTNGNQGTLQFFNLAKAGLTKYLDIGIVNQVYYNTKNDQSSWNYGDTSLRFGLQIMAGHPKWYIPDLRLVFNQSFPTGRYQHLNPQKDGIDATGSGSFTPQLMLASQFYLYNFRPLPHWNRHPLRIRLAMGYSIPIQTHVEGYNTYGGGIGTSGKLREGNTFFWIGAFEYSITQRWVLACDLQLVDKQPSKFHGKLGMDGDSIAFVGAPSKDTLSVAPGIEYNVNDKIGFITGVWVPIWGRNTPVFINYIFSLVYTF